MKTQKVRINGSGSIGALMRSAGANPRKFFEDARSQPQFVLITGTNESITVGVHA